LRRYRVSYNNDRDENFWSSAQATTTSDVRLMVKRVFITSDFGADSLPKWAGWVKAVVDGSSIAVARVFAHSSDLADFTADDLPLNVSRETLQSTRFLRQIKQVVLKHLIQLFMRLAEEDPENFNELQTKYGTALKLGAVEDTKNRNKLAALTRFSTNHRNSTSLDEVC
jgi:heat shock protein beta